MPLIIASDAFVHKSAIPRLYTCDGINISPPLQWSGIPDGCKSLVLVMDNPDAPDPTAPRMTWVHWLLYNIPASTTDLPEAIGPNDLPPGTLQGLNDWNRTGYGGPCPLTGKHRFFFKLYALDSVLPTLKTPTKAHIQEAMRKHILAETQLIGTYEREK